MGNVTDIRTILTKEEVSLEDFKLLYPRQNRRSLFRTAHYYMRPLVILGLAEKSGKGKWKLREDTLRTIERFEELRRKYGIKLDLYEFVSVLFTRTAQALKECSRGENTLDRIADEFEIPKGILAQFIKELLDNLEWKTTEDLMSFVRDIKTGRYLKIDGRVLTKFKRENRKRIDELKKEGRTEETATEEVLNVFLKKLPLSLDLWEEVEKDSGESIESWIEDRLMERSSPDGVTAIPVPKRLWDKLQQETKDLIESQRIALKEKLALRIREALDKTIKEAKEKKRKIRKK